MKKRSTKKQEKVNKLPEYHVAKTKTVLDISNIFLEKNKEVYRKLAK